jgi:lipoyl(octanoyl) transferase
LPYPLFPVNRGGQATYHGPGQLIGYPIFDLRRHGQDLHRYLRWLEKLLIELLGRYGIEASAREGLTGVWVQSRKIASIGVGVRHWISMHGFALNVCGDLAPFAQITPCGLADVTMTSMEREVGHELSVKEVADGIALIVKEQLSSLLKQAEEMAV